MTALAPHLTTFLREHLPQERRASPHTCEAYAYSFQLLLCFAASRLKTTPSRIEEALVSHLSRDEMQALLDAPNPRQVSGIRDRAMLHLAFAAGLRVSELVSIRLDQIDRQTVTSIHIMGKGRREGVLPLWKETTAALTAWLAVRPASGDTELFLNAVGRAMTRAGFEYILAKHAATAAQKLPSLADKRVTPHVLRHTCAMHTLKATRDARKVSLWLGTPACKARKSICGLIQPKNWRRLQRWRRRRSSRVALLLPTSYSRC
ncbi:tyrosine-type recombinase/integrase [Rhizobium johnstonii]|uniref:Integrase/recombinase n=1 Tax=Rhizobium johnstonii (strain DSM 114642 / LMG 32736 / 3841) TaxID=216596 RepID=Q1M9X5_RHIJ3|nr:putative integrase/recombinase [Rhizobium johnstonii 3841]